MQNVIGEMVVRVGVDSTNLDKGLAQGQSKMNSFATGMSKMGNAMMLGFSLPIAAAGVAVTKMAMDFETQMTNVYTLMDEGTIKSRDWGAEVLDLSKKLGMTSGDMAKGLYDIVSSGFEAGEAMHILEVSAMAANAGLSDTATSVAAVTAVLNAYNLKSKDSKKIADTLFKTVKYGVVTYPELASSIGRVISTAAAANVSFDEVGAAIAQMTLSGISADEAVTALNQVILNFLSPTDQAKEAAAQVGFELDAVTLSTEGLGGAMAELIDKLGISTEELVDLEKQGYSDEEMWDALAVKTGIQAETFAAIFSNVRALKGALSLATNEGKNYAEMQDNMANSSAGMSEAFEKQAQTTQFAFNLALSSIKATGIELGQKFLPKVTEVFNAIAKGAEKFGDLDEATQSSILSWAGFLAIMPLVLIAVGKTITGINGLKTAMATMSAMQVAPWITALIGFLPEIALGAGMVALQVNDMNNSFAGSEAVMAKLKKENPLWWFNQGNFQDVADFLSGGMNPVIERLNDAFLKGKIGGEAYAIALADITDKKLSAEKVGGSYRDLTAAETEVVNQCKDGTYELSIATEEMGQSIEENTKKIMDYRFANEGLIGVLQQIEGEYSSGQISAEDYEKAVAYLASTNGQYQGSIKNVYDELGILTKEQLGLAEATPEATAALNDQLDVVVDLEASFADLVKSLFQLYNLNQSVTESQWAFEDALKNLNEVTKNSASTEREVQEAIFGVQNAREDYISSVLAEATAEGITADRRKELITLYTQLGLAAIDAGETSSSKFLEIAKAAGVTKTELTTAIKEVGIEIDKVPKEIVAQTNVNKEKGELAMSQMFGYFKEYEESEPETDVIAVTDPATKAMEDLGIMMGKYESSYPETKVYADTRPAWDAISELTKYQIPTKYIGLKYGIPGFAHGGEVPGPIGVPRLAIVHGGERIINPYDPSSMAQILKAGGKEQSQTISIINKFEGAEFWIREESDIRKLSVELSEIQQDKLTGAGFKNV